jgi:WD40 repeat protein
VLQAHSGTVNKVSWAHPEFGPVLASCSVDRVVNIYQELVDSVHHQHTWSNVCHLVDSRDSVVDVKFAPRHLGLKLASCSADGTIRIYEAQVFRFFEIVFSSALVCLIRGVNRSGHYEFDQLVRV